MKLSLYFLLALALVATVALFTPLKVPPSVYATGSISPPFPPKPSPLGSSSAVTYTYFFPFIFGSGIDACSAIPGQTYHSITPNPPPPDRVTSQNADINLDLRGHELVNQYKGLWDYGTTPTPDPNAPQLSYLFSPRRLPTFTNTYQVGKWDWTCNCKVGWDDAWPVEMLGMGSPATEILYAPVSGYDIGLMPAGYAVMVLYATTQQITFVYHRYDSIVISDPNSPNYGQGYGIQVENMCVEPSLLALYNSLDSAGRHQLPALYANQPFGRSRGAEIRVTVRDSGKFMDPRSKRDWWQGY